MVENIKETLKYEAQFEGHNGWVTCLKATKNDDKHVLVSGSRDKTIMIWNLDQNHHRYRYGQPIRSLTGHSHFVQCLDLSQDGKFAISGSWDKTLRLWDLDKSSCRQEFVSHTNDVLSVAFSPECKQIISCGRDKTIKLWNVIGQCKHTQETDQHTDWITSLAYSPMQKEPNVFSASWDGTIKIWDLQLGKQNKTLKVEKNVPLNCIIVSPDGSLCAAGDKEGHATLYDMSSDEKGSKIHAFETKATINALSFSPKRFWLVAATNSGIKIWDLESRKLVNDISVELKNEEGKKMKTPLCLSIAWDSDGDTLYAGFSDNIIKVYKVHE